MQHTHAVIVGAGPIGLEVAARLKADGVDYLHFEAKQIGATMMWWPHGTRWFSSNERIAIAGVPLVTPTQEKATREQYLAYLRCVVGTHDLKVNAFEPVTDIDREPDGTFTVTTERHGDIRQTRCAKIIVAVGGTDRPRKLGVPGEELPHVGHIMEDPHAYFGRRLLVIGGMNSAVEAALRAHHAGATVALSYRGDRLPEESIKYWMRPEITGLVEKGRIEAHYRTEVAEIRPGRVTLARQVEGQAPEHFDVAADAVLSCIGYVQDSRLFRLAGLDLEDPGQRPVFDEATMQTSVPGIYVAGTAVAGTQSSKYRIFLENCHVHAERIAAHLAGRTADAPDPVIAQPES